MSRVDIERSAHYVSTMLDSLALARAPASLVASSIDKTARAMNMATNFPVYTSHYVPPGSAYMVATSNTSSATATINTSASTNSSAGTWYIPYDGISDFDYVSDPIPDPVLTPASHIREIKMKDGSVIKIDLDGNFVVTDAEAKVIYKAHRNRHFNPYVNAGDLVGRFIDYVRQEVRGVRRHDIPEIPLQLFVNWLILEAASKDGDPAPADVRPIPESRLLRGRVRPRCRLPSCQRFIARAVAAQGFNYCDPVHAERHLKLLKAA
jgi:hypothetical protein